MAKVTPEYQAWANAKTRCYNTSTRYYKNHGGRGIRVCERWLNSFTSFLSDMGVRPSSKHSLERKDNDGDYTPDNCVWALLSEQNNNKRTNVWIVFDGKTMTQKQWSRFTGIPKSTIQTRIKAGYSLERVFSEFYTPSLFSGLGKQ
jgi:hypothetical protein